MTTKKVTVRIQLRGHWEFCQDVQMTEKEFAKYDKLLDGGGRDYARAARELSGLYADPRDCEFEDADDVDDFRIVGEA